MFTNLPGDSLLIHEGSGEGAAWVGTLGDLQWSVLVAATLAISAGTQGLGGNPEALCAR